MTRASIADYAGARGRIELGQVRELGRRHVVQQKHDGCYVQVSTDARGRVVNVLSRTGQPMSEAADLIGIKFIPNAVLAGELDAHTETGNRLAATRGYRLCHLFDAIRIDGRYLAREPYHVRRDELHRAIALVELEEGNGRHWYDDHLGRAHGPAGSYVRRVPRSWRRFPLVEQHPVREALRLFEQATVDADVEGAVIVALDAKLGQRNAKRKCKPVNSTEALVLELGRGYVRCCVAGRVSAPFLVGVGRHVVRVGDVVEVQHSGWYERSATPRFPRIVRVRRDLAPRQQREEARAS